MAKLSIFISRSSHKRLRLHCVGCGTSLQAMTSLWIEEFLAEKHGTLPAISSNEDVMCSLENLVESAPPDIYTMLCGSVAMLLEIKKLRSQTTT